MSNLQKMAFGIRRRVLEHTVKNAGGYMSQACSAAEILSCLYGELLDLRPLEEPLIPGSFCGTPSRDNKEYKLGVAFNGGIVPGKDRFILSPTHYSLVLYAALIEAGRLHPDALSQFNKDGGIVEMIGAEHSPGMEVMTGSLGQGLAQAVGIALGKRLKKEAGTVWVLMSDGEFQVGMTFESLQFMNHYRLSNVRILVDVNGQQCDGTVDSVMAIEPLERRIESFGAVVKRVHGHDIEAILSAAKTETPNAPLVVLCQTDPCRGLEILRRNAPRLHYLRFKTPEEKKQYASALAEMEQNGTH